MKINRDVIVAVLIVLITAATSSYFTTKSVASPWYKCIKPSITPPAFVFPIAWTILYILVAIAFARSVKDKFLVQLFVANLFLNIVWCWAFFTAKYVAFSLLPILGILLTGLMIVMKTKDRVIRLVMAPYLLWISFATLLTILSMKKEENCRGAYTTIVSRHL